MIKCKDVENSTLKIGYNEEDYIVTSNQYPNCNYERITPRGFIEDTKWVRPKKMDKEYKFKLDKF